MTIDEIIEHCRRTVEFEKKYIVSGIRSGGKTYYSQRYLEHLQVEKYLEELKEYKQLGEQKRSIKLPCDVGDIVYLNEHRFHTVNRPIKCRINEFTIDKYGCYAVLDGEEKFYRLTRFRAINIKWFGEKVFMNEEEAMEKWREYYNET